MYNSESKAQNFQHKNNPGGCSTPPGCLNTIGWGVEHPSIDLTTLGIPQSLSFLI